MVVRYRKIILLGRTGAGKSSLRGAQFHDRRQFDNLAPTGDITHSSLRYAGIYLKMQDYGGTKEEIENQLRDETTTFSNVDAMLFFFDASVDDMSADFDHYQKALKLLLKHSPEAKIFIFLTKTDLLSVDEDKLKYVKTEVIKCNRTIMCCQIALNFKMKYLPTTVYDHTFFKAWSIVFQNTFKEPSHWKEKLRAMGESMNMERIVLVQYSNYLIIANLQIGQMGMVDDPEIGTKYLYPVTTDNDDVDAEQMFDRIIYFKRFTENLMLLCVAKDDSLAWCDMRNQMRAHKRYFEYQ